VLVSVFRDPRSLKIFPQVPLWGGLASDLLAPPPQLTISSLSCPIPYDPPRPSLYPPPASRMPTQTPKGDGWLLAGRAAVQQDLTQSVKARAATLQ